jgi:WD40 repeat protein
MSALQPRAASPSPDGVATADDGGTVRVWQADDLGAPRSSSVATRPVYAASFSPDGTHCYRRP